MRTMRMLIVATLAAVLAWPVVAVAQAQSPKALVITAHNVTAAAASGRKNSTLARPGDEIRYTLVFTNLTQGPVKNVQFEDPIPHGLVYVLGSAAARQPTRIAFSIDGGKTYSAEPTIEVEENGHKVTKPAPRELYTHVRWTVLESVAPGAQVTAEFRAQLNAGPGEAK